MTTLTFATALEQFNAEFGRAERTTEPLSLATAVQIADLAQLFHDLEEYFESRSDCDDGQPNQAMRFLTAIEQAKEVLLP